MISAIRNDATVLSHWIGKERGDEIAEEVRDHWKFLLMVTSHRNSQIIMPIDEMSWAFCICGRPEMKPNIQSLNASPLTYQNIPNNQKL